MNRVMQLRDLMIWDGISPVCRRGNLTIKAGRFVPEEPGADSTCMKGFWAIPGFTDSHVHLVNHALAQEFVNLEGLSLERIRSDIDRIAGSKSSGEWIRGRGWEAARRDQGGFPDRNEIDDLTPNNPVSLSSKDGHTLWLNTVALNTLGIPDSIDNPHGGQYDRRKDGTLTGIIRENAADSVRDRIPRIDNSERKRLIRQLIPKLHSQGIVAVHSFEGIPEIDLLADMKVSDELPIHVLASFNLEDLGEAISRGYRTGDDVGGILLGGLKLFADGALGSRSAAVTHAYTGEPENFGMDVQSVDAMREGACIAAENGLVTAVHAIGDRAVKQALDAMIPARSILPGHNGFRLEHVQLIQPDDLARMAKHDICASVQPCHMISDLGMVARFWTRQTGLLYPYGTMHKSKIRLVLGTDAPIEDENPVWNIDAAVTRRSRNQGMDTPGWHVSECLTRAEAFFAATRAPALIENPGRQRGAICNGFSADFVLFDSNPMDPDLRPGDLRIKAVFVSGVQVT